MCLSRRIGKDVHAGDNDDDDDADANASRESD